MNRKKGVLLIILFISSLNLFSQKEIYLDEDLNPINPTNFSALSKTHLYQTQTINTDSIIIKKLDYNYEFGKLSEIELKQTQNLIQKEFGIKDFNKNIIISYIDTIQGFEEFNKNIEARKLLDQSDIITFKEYEKARKRYDKQQKKCIKYTNKENSIPLYTFTFNNNYIYKTTNHKKLKISNALRSIFFKSKKSGFVILKPDGNFFYYRHLTQDYVSKFLNENWTRYIMDIEVSKKSLYPKKIRFITQMYQDHRTKHLNLALNEIKHRKNNPQKTKNIVLQSHSVNKKPSTILVKNNQRCYTYPNY